MGDGVAGSGGGREAVAWCRGPARATAGLVLVAAAGLGLAAGCSSGGSHPPKSDVKISSCRTESGGRKAIVTGTVHNNSSKRSNYGVQVDVTANGSKIESGFASILRIDPGERKTFTIHPLGVDVPTGTKLTCTLARVTRIGG